MADQAAGGLPRVAFVYGDADLATHVREAVAGSIDIAYATSFGEFDETRLADARVAAALVNLDAGDWLDTLETRLDAAGIRVVFNDPEISRGLDGWERARWLRHVVAKLRGSDDFDPPRPVATATPEAGLPALQKSVMADAPVQASNEPEPAFEDAGSEQPLSSHEIEAMTADFVAVPDADMPPTVALHEPPAVEASAVPATEPAPAMQLEPIPDMPPVNNVSAPEPAATEAPAAVESIDELSLDVDTEALSAMIDAKLAEPEAPAGHDADATWASPESSSEAPAAKPVEVAVDTVSEPTETDSQNDETGQEVTASTASVVTAGDSDADVLASLPALDDWQLIDPDAEVAPAANAAQAHKPSEPTFSDSFAGLELVPMEAASPIEHNVDPIERWFDKTDEKTKAGANAQGDKS